MAQEVEARVLKEGFLKKRSRESALLTNWRRRYFRLYAGELLYFVTPQDVSERRRVPLSLDTQVSQTNDQGYATCFMVKATPTGENFYLQAENDEEKAEWISAIFNAARRTADVSPPPAEERKAAVSTPPPAPVPMPKQPAAALPPARVILDLNVVEARGLIAADLNGKSDPYCTVTLLGKDGQPLRGSEMRTEYVTDTLTPVWNKHFKLGQTVDLRTVEVVRFELWDHDHVTRNSLLGSVQIPLSLFQMSPASMSHSELVDRWFRIEPPPVTSVAKTLASAFSFGSSTSGAASPPSPRSHQMEEKEKDILLKPHGELHLAMSISGPNLVDFFQSVHASIAPQNRIVLDGVEHTDNRLEVGVIAAKDLISADLNNSSDPFVELTLLDESGKPIRGESFTTSVKYKTKNPCWDNEHHVFGRISRIDQAVKLHVRVLDWDRHSKNDPLGCVTIDLEHLSAHLLTDWYPLVPEERMTVRENLGAVQLTISLIGETQGERKRRLTIHKELTLKSHEQSVEQLELENAQYALHDAACKLDGARIACAVDDYQSRQPQFYGINGCIHHLNTQIPRAHRETTSTEEGFQTRTGLESQAQLEISVIGAHDLPKTDTMATSNPYAIIEMDPAVCVEERKHISVPISPQKSKRIQAMNAATSESRNAMFSKRTTAEVSQHRARLAKNEVRSEQRHETGTSGDHPVLKVHVKSGHGLSAADIGGYSDPYCTLTVIDRKSGKVVENEKKRTAVLTRTLNPVWESEVFYFGNSVPLEDTSMLVIHVKDHNNFGRSTPLGRVQISMSDLCHASATSTSISSTAREKRYPLTPEPWMKKHAEDLGELCLQTEVTGDATLLAKLLQSSPTSNSPENALSFLSMSSFSSDMFATDSVGASTTSLPRVEHEDEVTEIVDKGKVLRTATAVGNTATWRKEKFTLNLSYPGVFSDTHTDQREQYTLHIRVFGARNLMRLGVRSTSKGAASNLSSQNGNDDASTNAYFTVIPVLVNGQLEHLERKQSLTVYGTRNPNWPDQEFAFNKLKDLASVAYLSLHVYTRDVEGGDGLKGNSGQGQGNSTSRPLIQILSSHEQRQTARLKRFLIHKLAPSGEVEDDGLEVLPYDQRVLAFRCCADGGRFVPARVRQYRPFPEDDYDVLFEDTVASIEDLWNFMSLDLKGEIKAMHADGTVDVRLLRDIDMTRRATSSTTKSTSDAISSEITKVATSNVGRDSMYVKNVPLSRLIPVNSFTDKVEMIAARRVDASNDASIRWSKLLHTLSGLNVTVLSVSGLPRDVEKPGCIVTLLGNPVASSSASLPSGWNFNSFNIGKHGQLIASKNTVNPMWKIGEPLSLAIPFASKSRDVADLHLFEINPLILGQISLPSASGGTADVSESEELLSEGMEIMANACSILIRVVDQGKAETPSTSHRTLGFVRVDLATLRDGDQELNLRLLPTEAVPYFTFYGSVCVKISCVDAANTSKNDAALKEAVKKATQTKQQLAEVSNQRLRNKTPLCGAIVWFERRMLAERNPNHHQLSADEKKGSSLSRIARRQLLRTCLTPTENAQVDAFNAVLVVIMKRVVSIQREIRLLEEFESLPTEEMRRFHHLHTVNANANSEWLGRAMNELSVETRKDIVVHLEMELLDLCASQLPRVYPTTAATGTTSREEWLRLRAERQLELQRVDGWMVQDRTSTMVLSLPCTFTGEGMISWILRGPAVLWQDEWVKYCQDATIKTSCKLCWQNSSTMIDLDAVEPPKSREQALLWLSMLSDAGFVENVSMSLASAVGDTHKKHYLVEDKADQFYRLREVDMWVHQEKHDNSVFPLDLVQEVDCYATQDDPLYAASSLFKEEQMAAQQLPSAAPSSPAKGPSFLTRMGTGLPQSERGGKEGGDDNISATKATSPTVADLAKSAAEANAALLARRKMYAKKLTPHLEGFLGTQNVLSSVLFSKEIQENPLLKPVAATTQKLMAEDILWNWKYSIFIPAKKRIFIYERETAKIPTIIVDMSSTECHGAFNFAYDKSGGWFDVVNATILHKTHSSEDTIGSSTNFVPINDKMLEKLTRVQKDGRVAIEFKTSEAQLWVQAFIRAGIRFDVKPGQRVFLKQLNATAVHQKCIHHVTDFNADDLDGSFQRLLNCFFEHDTQASHHVHEQRMRELRNTFRSEMKKSSRVGETVMAYYGKGQRLNPKPTNERLYTTGALYSGRIVRIRTPFTDTKYRFTHTYEIAEAPKAMTALLARYHVTDKASWVALPRSLRDVFLLYDVEYRHAHEVIIEEGLLREHLRTNDGDLDPAKVEERVTDLNLVFKASDLEDCVTRMVVHSGGRKPLGCVKIPIKMVSSRRVVDGWYPLAPENEMLQKVQLGQVRVQLRLEHVRHIQRSHKVSAGGALLLDDVRDAIGKQQGQPSGLGTLAAAAGASPIKFLKDKMSIGRSTRQIGSSSLTAAGSTTLFTVAHERSFIKVTIVEGRKMIAADFLTSDPFVKLILLREKDDKEVFTKLKTDIKSKTLNPRWQNQEFMLGKTEATMLRDKKALILRVMDHDLASADDPMGYLRFDFQRDKVGAITDLVVTHGDDKGHPAARVLHVDPRENNRVEIDERLLADEQAGQSKTASARGNNGASDGKLGRLRVVLELQQNENAVDPEVALALGPGMSHLSSSPKRLAASGSGCSTAFSLEISLKSVAVVGNKGSVADALGIPGFKEDWSPFTCEFVPFGDGGHRVPYDPHVEDLGVTNTLRLSELIQHSLGSTISGTSTPGSVPTSKILGRTYDMSVVSYFDVRVFSESTGKVFRGRYGRPNQFKSPSTACVSANEVIVLCDKENKSLELHITLDASVVALQRSDRVQRVLAETMRVVGLNFNPHTVNQQQRTAPTAVHVTSGGNDTSPLCQPVHGGAVHQFLWEVCKVSVHSGVNLAQELLSQVQRLRYATRLHWRFTPQLLGFLFEHVFRFGNDDRLSYIDAAALDDVLQRWSRVLQHIHEAKNQLIGHLHGRETPRLIHALMSECDWTGFEWATLQHTSTDTASYGERAVSSPTDRRVGPYSEQIREHGGDDHHNRQESVLRAGTKVHALLPGCRHAGVAVDVRLGDGGFIAGTIVAEHGDDSFDVAFCTSARVHEEGDDDSDAAYLSDDESELPPLCVGHTVFVCPTVLGHHLNHSKNLGLSQGSLVNFSMIERVNGRIGVVKEYDEVGHAKAPYLILFGDAGDDKIPPATEWMPRSCLDSMFPRVMGGDVVLQLNMDDIVRVLPVAATSSSPPPRLARVTKNHRNAKYDIAFLTAADRLPMTETDVLRERLQPMSEKTLYDGEVSNVYLTSCAEDDTQSEYVIRYDVALINGDIVTGISRDHLRLQAEQFGSDRAILASVHFSQLNIQDAMGKGDTAAHTEMAKRVNELWSSDQLVKVYVQLPHELAALNLRDNVTNKRLQTRLSERNERQPRFVDQCHGYTKGSQFSEMEATKLVQIAQANITANRQRDVESSDVDVNLSSVANWFCLYLAPQPRIEMHGMLRLLPRTTSPSVVDSSSSSAFRSLLGLATKDNGTCLARMMQRLLRATASEHMPLNRKERVVVVKRVDVCFYRKPVTDVVINSLTSTCDGVVSTMTPILTGHPQTASVTAVPMKSVGFAHVSVNVVFSMGVPYSSRGSMADSLTIAHQDANKILQKLTTINALKRTEGGIGYGDGDDQSAGVWEFTSETRETSSPVPRGVVVEVLDRDGNKDSSPSLSLELVPLADQRLTAYDKSGGVHELCLPVDKILVEAKLRRDLMPYFDARVVDGPRFLDQEQAQQHEINKRARRESLQQGGWLEPLALGVTHQRSAVRTGRDRCEYVPTALPALPPPCYCVERIGSRDGKKKEEPIWLARHDIKFDTLHIQIMQASELKLKDNKSATGSGDIVMEVLLQSCDFTPQLEHDTSASRQTQFGILLSETGEISRDLSNRKYPDTSTVVLSRCKEAFSTEWKPVNKGTSTTSGGSTAMSSSLLSFGHPSIDLDRVAGVTVKLWTKSPRVLIGTTFIAMSDIPETKHLRNSADLDGCSEDNGNNERDAKTEPLGRRASSPSRRRFKLSSASSASKGLSVTRNMDGQTFPVYRKDGASNGNNGGSSSTTVVGKIQLQLERSKRIRVGDSVMAKGLPLPSLAGGTTTTPQDENNSEWCISSHELLSCTLQQIDGDPSAGGLLSATSLHDGGGARLFTDPVEQELQVQRLVSVMMISRAMETLHATRPSSSTQSAHSSNDGGTGDSLPLAVKTNAEWSISPRMRTQLMNVVTQTKWFIEDTAVELGMASAGKRLPWSSEAIISNVSPQHKTPASHDSMTHLEGDAANSATRLRRTMLKLYHMYRNRLIPTLRRLHELDAMGEHVDLRAGEQLLAFFEQEVEDLNAQDQRVYRRLYQRLRVVKIAQVLQDIMRATLRVRVMDQDLSLGDDEIGTAYIPLLDLLDQGEHENLYELTKTRRTHVTPTARSALSDGSVSPQSKWTVNSTTTITTIKQGKVHLRLHLSYSQSSLLEQATYVFKFLKAKYLAQHETARRRINAAVVPAQRRRWLTVKGYLDELDAMTKTKLHWERTPVLLSLVWDIFTPQDGSSNRQASREVEEDQMEGDAAREQQRQGLAEKAAAYRATVVAVHTRWVNLQPKLEELLRMQAATQLHAQRTPQLLEELERDVEGMDLVLVTAWRQVQSKWTVLLDALEELAGMAERNKLHLGRAPQLLHLVSQRCSRGLSERHAEAVSSVQFRWMAIMQPDGPLCELRVMEKKPLHWRRTHELVLLLNEQCEGFADVDARALESVQRRWEQAQDWLEDVVAMQQEHVIDCEATPFILKKMHLLEPLMRTSRAIGTQKNKNKTSGYTDRSHMEKSGAASGGGYSPRRAAALTSVSEVATDQSPGSEAVVAENGVVTLPGQKEEDVGRVQGLVEWYAIEEAKRELERIPFHRITTDQARKNWLPFSRDGKDTRLRITQEEMAFTPANVRQALVERGVIPQFAERDGETLVATEVTPALLEEIRALEKAVEGAAGGEDSELADAGHSSAFTFSYWKRNPERVAELTLLIERLGKSDLLWKLEHVVNNCAELAVPSRFVTLLEEMQLRQIATTELEDLVRALTVQVQKEALHKRGVDVPANANFSTVLSLMHRHQVQDIALPMDVESIQEMLHVRGMDRRGEPVFLRGMRIGTQARTPPHSAGGQDETDPSTRRPAINTGLGIMDTQIEVLRKSLLMEALRRRNSMLRTFPGHSRLFGEDDDELMELAAAELEVDTSGDYLTLIERFQQVLIHESYTARLAEYAAMDRCMRALLGVPRDQIVTKQDIAVALQSVSSSSVTRFQLPLEAFTEHELYAAAQAKLIREPTQSMLARCPRGRNAEAMAMYAAVSYAARVYQETVSFRARVDPVTQRVMDALPFDAPSSVDGMALPKRARPRLTSVKQYVVDWLLGDTGSNSEDTSVVMIRRRLSAYHTQRLRWATAAFTLRDRWFHRGHGWCDLQLGEESEISQDVGVGAGAGVLLLLQRLLVSDAANRMHMTATQALLRDVQDKCMHLRPREQDAERALRARFEHNTALLEQLVGHAEKCINQRRLHSEETPALLHAIEQACVVPHGLTARHREAYHVVVSHWLPLRARMDELVRMHQSGTFSIQRTPELLQAMARGTEGIAGTGGDTDLEGIHKQDEIRHGKTDAATDLNLNLDLDLSLDGEGTSKRVAGEWQSLSPAKRVIQPLSPSTGSASPRRRKSSLGDEIKEMLRSPTKWLMAGTEEHREQERIHPEFFFPRAVSHGRHDAVDSCSDRFEKPVAATAAHGGDDHGGSASANTVGEDDSMVV